MVVKAEREELFSKKEQEELADVKLVCTFAPALNERRGSQQNRQVEPFEKFLPNCFGESKNSVTLSSAFEKKRFATRRC